MKPINLSDEMHTTNAAYGERVHTLETFLTLSMKFKQEGKRLVQCDGVFDFLHGGHIEYFSQAKEHGDVLYVALVADKFVNKGRGRPIFDEKTRALWIASIRSVDYVTINYAPGPQNILEVVKPNILVKGKDYISKPPQGFLENKTCVESYGGQIAYVKELAHSTEIFKRIHNLFS